MTREPDLSEASQDYSDAYHAQYTGRDLVAALDLHAALIASYPASKEAGYSRAQIENIVHAVVSPEDLLAAYIGLVRARIRHTAAPEAATAG